MRASRAVVLLALLVGAGGCAQLLGSKPVAQRRKFTVVAQPVRLALPHSERPYPYKVQVKKFAISRLYDRDQFVSRLSAYEVQEDRWNTWAFRPGEMLTTVVERYLNEVRLFAQIRQEFLDERPDYVFAASVKAIERFTQGQQTYAHLAMAMSLEDQKSGEVVWSAEFDKVQPVYARDISATTEALSNILHDQVEIAIRDLDFRFLNRMRQGRGLPPLSSADLASAAGAADSLATGGGDAVGADYEILPGRLANPEER
jgi:ABC-type uncharacterized transport system auxiliary subunit